MARYCRSLSFSKFLFPHSPHGFVSLGSSLMLPNPTFSCNQAHPLSFGRHVAVISIPSLLRLSSTGNCSAFFSRRGRELGSNSRAVPAFASFCQLLPPATACSLERLVSSSASGPPPLLLAATCRALGHAFWQLHCPVPCFFIVQVSGTHVRRVAGECCSFSVVLFSVSVRVIRTCKADTGNTFSGNTFSRSFVSRN